jgi:hypothetical protein
VLRQGVLVRACSIEMRASASADTASARRAPRARLDRHHRALGLVQLSAQACDLALERVDATWAWR